MAYLGTEPANAVVTSEQIADGVITPNDLSTGKPVWDTSGNVGIGTTSPNSAGVNRALTISGTSNSILELNSGATRVGYLYSSGSTGATILSAVPASSILQFNTVDTERMRIDSSGNLLVGTTSVPSGAGSGSGRITATTLNLTDGIRSHQGSGGAFGGNSFNFYWTGNAQLWVDSTNIGNIAFSSDYRIKRNIETQTESGIEKVLKLRPVTYQMADYGDMFKASDDIKEGFIAHEVQEVIPSGAEGVKDEENRIQNLKLDAILSVAVKAIQELKAELDATKAEVEAQAARIAALESN